MNNYFNFRCYAPYSCNSYDKCITLNEIPNNDYKAPYYDLTPNAIGACNHKVWYKMKDGYIQQYTYSVNDDINYVTKKRYQYYGSQLEKCQEIAKSANYKK
jgi:hypothetical protein